MTVECDRRIDSCVLCTTQSDKGQKIVPEANWTKDEGLHDYPRLMKQSSLNCDLSGDLEPLAIKEADFKDA